MKAIELKCSGKRDADFGRLCCVLACVGKDRMQLDRLHRRRKMAVMKPRPKTESASWWNIVGEA
jgi:hypothetical protein